ncbi:dihydrofolate reductase family protein [Rhizobium bangladeshense]|uniref:dihydrofolate reductase family protein n=1 Tax=Rhizobium bangladeshense TaxID=1138189 RepID=UPI000A86FD44|nr:dihydrofolate reductase family protein [Rhizobium bangladeshense]
MVKYLSVAAERPCMCPAHAEFNWSTHMRKLIVGSFVSLDGVVESPMAWASRFFTDEAVEDAYQKAGEADYFLLGRKTYEMFAARWPALTGKYMDRMNGLKKLVVSNTLADVRWNASILNGDIVGKLRELKTQDGGNLLKYGISELDRTLLENELVDAYELSIIPTRVGAGKRAFEDVPPELVDFDLAGLRSFSNGVVVMTYVPKSRQRNA